MMSRQPTCIVFYDEDGYEMVVNANHIMMIESTLGYDEPDSAAPRAIVHLGNGEIRTTCSFAAALQAWYRAIDPVVIDATTFEQNGTNTTEVKR